ncbi:uncharacterized protein LOC125573014 [Nematostella vectensis]|uniref:uncharacterized protein LOC125573014 n=1 Tax=Nematostella vectensis TaxID=45351 RepID=UPI002076F06B|nr:uncharacterized protein LOC125573014 [Nematostella vectensis]
MKQISLSLSVLLLFLVVLWSPQTESCGLRPLTCKVLRHLSDDYVPILLRKKPNLANDLGTFSNTRINIGASQSPKDVPNAPGRTSRAADHVHRRVGTTCPWSWETDEDSDRFPKFIMRAVCTDRARCGVCRKVFYEHTVLRRRCDASLGLVWERGTHTVPIAFVRDV